MFDKLNEVRSVSRARAVEDFHFFATAVCGSKLESRKAKRIQKAVEKHGVFVSLGEQRQISEGYALRLWLVVLGLRRERVRPPTETFAWLFPEYCEATQVA